MTEIHFEDGGALLADSRMYIEREADALARRHLRRMEYVTLVEPRQQGKTSLINRLTGHLAPQGYVFAYADLTTFDKTDEAAWYGSVCDWLLRQARFIAVANRPKAPVNGNTWRNFLCDLAEAAEEAGLNLVLALDEVGATPAAWATDFFSAIRSVYNSRQSMPCFRHLTFIVAGAFNPKELIRDHNISNFNVDHRIPLEDFTLEQVRQMVRHLKPSDAEASVAERLHYWTEGQPFIIQRLCRYLAEQDAEIVPVLVDRAVERFFREDTNHLSRIFHDLHDEPKLLDYAWSTVAKRNRFSPSVNEWQFRLSHVIGIIAPDQNGRCRIRNRIYEQALQFDAHPEQTKPPDPPTAHEKEAGNMDIPSELIEQLRKGNVVVVCGAGISVSDGGIPSGGHLAKELAVRAGLGAVGSMTLPDVAQGYEMEMGHQSLIAFIAERIEGAGHSPLRTHQLMAALPFKYIITTNWDTLLEEALRQAGKPAVKLVRDEDVAYVDDEKVTLIKLHGSIDQKDTIVVTGDDYYDVFARLPETANLVRSFFATKTLLFLGYGLADEDFKRMYHEVERHLGKHKRRAYAVQLSPTPLAVKYWQQKNVEVIAADAAAFLEALIREMSATSLPPTLPSPEKVPVSSPPTIPSTSRTTVAAISQPTGRSAGGAMDYTTGFQALRDCLTTADTGRLSELSTLESRFQENQRAERVFGSSENTRNERAQVIFALNELALQHCGVSFNELCQGAKAKRAAASQSEPNPAPPTSSPRPDQGWANFKLQLARHAGLEFEARALTTPMGEPHAASQLPFDAVDLIAVLKVLEQDGYDPNDFTSIQTEALQRLGLVRDGQLSHDHLKRIGQGLYNTLFAGDVGMAFRVAFNQARQARQTVFLQLRFDSDAVELARYPWELLHDGQRHLLSAGAVEMTRYITYGEAASSLPVEPPARLLFVESRPKDLTTLPQESERLAVWNSLQALTGNGKVALERLDPPTFDALLDRIASADYHLVHFDGHGHFARCCPRCRATNYPHLTTCYSCQSPLDNVSPQGYLAFEDGAGKADFVSTEDMENLLLNSQVRLMFLSACKTGVVRGDSLFGGLGPGLIRAGVPAVVAMQFSVPVQATIGFAEGFYTALARGETVSRAVAQGRRQLFRDKTWFIPTLYLRSQDDEGHIFAP